MSNFEQALERTDGKTLILSNGSKWAGQDPDSIQTLLDVLGDNVLDPMFEQYHCYRPYPDDLTIEYSLGYCQGDGVAFYGDLSVDDVKALMNRLFSTEPGQVDAVSRVKNLMAQKDIENMLSVLREYGSCDLSITRNSHGHHYSHWNCMNIDDNVDFTGIFPDDDSMIGTGIEGINQDMVERWQDLWERFVLELADDVKSLSKKLEADGYSLIEASPCEDEVVWERATENYLVRVTELPERDFDMGHWDDEVRDQTICSILEGKERVLGLRVEVLSRENEIVLGEESLHGLTVASDDKSYAGYRRELLRGAIQQTRDFFSRHLKAA